MTHDEGPYNPAQPTIAHVLHQLSYAGAEVLAADLARKLHAQFRFVFLCLDNVGSLGQSLADEGFEVVHLRRRPGVDLSVARRLRQAADELGIDLFHAHQYTPFFYAALSRRFRSHPPILFTEHGRHYPDRRRLKRVLANKLLLRRHDRVTAVGRFVKQSLTDNEGIPSGKIDVIHNGIDPRRFPHDDRAAAVRASARSELGVQPHEQVILQVARFHPVKDHATAIHAFAQASPQTPTAQLVLAGDGEQRSVIQALVSKLNLSHRVRFLGVRRDIPQLMAAADVFLLSSLSEGISVTLLEAMASSLPIVATDVGGNREVVVHNTTGLLSPRSDTPSLAQNLLTLLHNPERGRQMGRAGRSRLLEHFTEQQMHTSFARIYREMLGVG